MKILNLILLIVVISASGCANHNPYKFDPSLHPYGEVDTGAIGTVEGARFNTIMTRIQSYQHTQQFINSRK